MNEGTKDNPQPLSPTELLKTMGQDYNNQNYLGVIRSMSLLDQMVAPDGSRVTDKPNVKNLYTKLGKDPKVAEALAFQHRAHNIAANTQQTEADEHLATLLGVTLPESRRAVPPSRISPKPPQKPPTIFDSVGNTFSNVRDDFKDLPITRRRLIGGMLVGAGLTAAVGVAGNLLKENTAAEREKLDQNLDQLGDLIGLGMPLDVEGTYYSDPIYRQRFQDLMVSIKSEVLKGGPEKLAEIMQDYPDDVVLDAIGRYMVPDPMSFDPGNDKIYQQLATLRIKEKNFTVDDYEKAAIKLRAKRQKEPAKPQDPKREAFFKLKNEVRNKRFEKINQDNNRDAMIDRELNRYRVNLVLRYGAEALTVVSYDFRKKKVDIVDLNPEINIPEIADIESAAGVASDHYTLSEPPATQVTLEDYGKVIEDATGLSADFITEIQTNFWPIFLVSALGNKITIDLPEEKTLGKSQDNSPPLQKTFPKGPQILTVDYLDLFLNGNSDKIMTAYQEDTDSIRREQIFLKGLTERVSEVAADKESSAKAQEALKSPQISEAGNLFFKLALLFKGERYKGDQGIVIGSAKAGRDGGTVRIVEMQSLSEDYKDLPGVMPLVEIPESLKNEPYPFVGTKALVYWDSVRELVKQRLS